MSSGYHSLGLVTVAAAGTPVNALAQSQAVGRDSGQETTSPPQATTVHTITVQSWVGNAGPVYVGRSADMVRATGVDVIQYLPAAGDSISIEITKGANALSLASLWIDADNGDDAVLVSYLRA